MIDYVHGDILQVKAELLINASNGKGYMGGYVGRFIKLRGVAEAIHYADHTIEKIAKQELKKNPTKCGDVLHTASGKLPFARGILHAVTMEKPGQTSSLGIVRACVLSILQYCKSNDIKTVAIPLLGTGTGRLNTTDVLELYKELLQDTDTIFIIAVYKKA